jgi:hypothetical protein
MESNELKKSEASEETGLLKNVENDEATPSVADLKSTDVENDVSAEEVESSFVVLSESLTDPVFVSDSAEEDVEEVLEESLDSAPALEGEVNVEVFHDTLFSPEVELVSEVDDVPEIKPVLNLDAIPKPFVEVAGTAETALIDQIVQIPDEADDDDDLFSDSEPDAHAIPIHDYSSYSKIQLVNTLRKILSEGTVDEIRPHAEAIKGCFYKIRNSEIQEQKLAFTAEGNEEELFEAQEDSFEAELKDLLKEYKNLRAELNKKQEAVKEENYHKKLAIIEEIKSLINSEESINMTFQEFNNLQEKWKGIGQVPQTKVKDLWENYHYNVELFYDFVKINRELRDLDLRRNMDEKSKLCIKAEELAALADAEALSTFRELQKLHEAWREIGPVPRESKQELWERVI